MKNTWRAIIVVFGLSAPILVAGIASGPVHGMRAGQILPLESAGAASSESPPSNAPLPPGVKAVWNLDKAFRERTPTRERVCLNGLWRWQPAKELADAVPADNWGYFKVPGFWPGDSSYPFLRVLVAVLARPVYGE